MDIKKIKNNKIIRKLILIYQRCDEHDCYATSGHIAYKIMLSVVPMAIVLAVLFSAVPFIENWIMETLQPVLAPQAYAFVKYISELAAANATTPIFSIGMAVTLYTASSGLYTLMKGVSIAEDGRGSFEKRGVLKNRLLAIVLTIIIFILILCCALVSIELNYFDTADNRQIISYAFIIIMLVVMLMFIYKISPVKKTYWLTSLKRALLSAIMIVALTFAMNIYYTEFSKPENVYGTFAGLAIIMIWIYSISFCILIAGEV